MSFMITTVIRFELSTVCNRLSMILLVTRNCCNSKIFPVGDNSIMSVENRYGLEVGSMVEVPVGGVPRYGVPRYGVIRWMGNIPQVKGRLVAGLELVSEIYQTE